nr:hypothetical protein [Geobacillus sp. FW23]
MMAFWLTISLLLHALSFWLIIVLFLRLSRLGEAERRAEELEEAMTAYLAAWKEENERFLAELDSLLGSGAAPFVSAPETNDAPVCNGAQTGKRRRPCWGQEAVKSEGGSKSEQRKQKRRKTSRRSGEKPKNAQKQAAQAPLRAISQTSERSRMCSNFHSPDQRTRVSLLAAYMRKGRRSRKLPNSSAKGKQKSSYGSNLRKKRINRRITA